MGQSQSSVRTSRQDNASTRTLHSASLNSHRPVSFFRRISNRLQHPSRRRRQQNTVNAQPNNSPPRHTSASSTTSSVRRATQEARRAAAAVTGPPNFLPVNNSSRNSIISSSESTNTTHLLNELLTIREQQQQGGNSYIQYLQIPLRMQEINHDSQSSASSTTSRRMHILVIEYRPSSSNIPPNNTTNESIYNMDNIPLTPPPTFRFLGLRRPRSQVSTTSSTETIQSMPLSTYSTQTNQRTNNINQQHHHQQTQQQQTQPQPQPQQQQQQQDGQWIVYVLNNNNMNANSLQALSSSLILEDNPSYEDLLWLSNILGQVRPNTTTQAAVEEAIPVTIWSDDTKTQVNHEQCLVCLDEFALKQPVRILKCQHVFHRECVDRWLCEAHNSCPVCRGVPV